MVCLILFLFIEEILYLIGWLTVSMLSTEVIVSSNPIQCVLTGAGSPLRVRINHAPATLAAAASVGTMRITDTSDPRHFGPWTVLH